MGKRNKNAGYVFEVEVKSLVEALGFPHVTLSRMESIARDRQKIDLMNKEEGKHGRIPWNFQCKNIASGSKLNFQKILDEMPKGEGVNILAYNHTVKQYNGANLRFLTKGQYAISTLSDQFKLLQEIQNLKKGFALLNTYFDSIPEQDKAWLSQQLEALGL